jgi:hypothetical protein
VRLKSLPDLHQLPWLGAEEATGSVTTPPYGVPARLGQAQCRQGAYEWGMCVYGISDRRVIRVTGGGDEGGVVQRVAREGGVTHVLFASDAV